MGWAVGNGFVAVTIRCGFSPSCVSGVRGDCSLMLASQLREELSLPSLVPRACPMAQNQAHAKQ